MNSRRSVSASIVLRMNRTEPSHAAAARRAAWPQAINYVLSARVTPPVGDLFGVSSLAKDSPFNLP